MKLKRAVTQWFKFTPDSGESGQAIVLIGVAAFALLAIMGLAIDGGRLLFLKRETQNASDAAAIAAARALCQGRDYIAAGMSAANVNGFDNNGDTNTVVINSPPQHASIEIPEKCLGCYLEVVVSGNIPATFIGLVYDGPLAATSHAIGTCNPDLNAGIDEDGIRALWSMSTTCQNTVDFTGSEFYIEGGIHSNSDIHSGGGGSGTAVVVGPSSYVTTLDVPDGKIDWQMGSFGGEDNYTATGQCAASCFLSPEGEEGGGGGGGGNPYQTEVKPNYPLTHDIEDYAPGGSRATVAAAAGKYYYADCKSYAKGIDAKWLEDNNLLEADGSLKEGLYFSECDINLSDAKGTATLVARGSIQVSGGGNLHYYMDKLVGFSDDGGDKCTAKVLKFSGSGVYWTGNFFAPHGRAEISTSSMSTLEGCIVSHSMNLSASNSQIICHPDTEAPAIPGIWLSE